MIVEPVVMVSIGGNASTSERTCGGAGGTNRERRGEYVSSYTVEQLISDEAETATMRAHTEQNWRGIRWM